MKRFLFFIVFLVSLISYALNAQTNLKDPSTFWAPYTISLDSILHKATFWAPYYNDFFDEYRANVYIKGQIYLKKRNHLIRFIPHMFRPKKGINKYLVESYSEMHFTAPNIFDYKVKAMYGTVNRMGGVAGDVFDYFRVNVYNPTLIRGKLLSPLAPEARRYYRFTLDSVYVQEGYTQYRIAFKPRTKNYQLVKGYMVITDKVWSMREMRFAGRSEYLHFDNIVRMGDVGSLNELLPVRSELTSTFAFMGNVAEGRYVADMQYTSTDHKEEFDLFVLRDKKKYDLTESYSLQTDTTRFIRDSLTLCELRPFPLEKEEQQIYDDYFSKKESENEYKKRKSSQFWGQVGDMLVSDYTINLSKVGSVKGSALINPFLMSYSGTNGVSYRQTFKYNQLFVGDRLLYISPRIGYNFKHKEFYWRVSSNFEYWPEKRSSFYLEFGNGNRIYSSEMLDEIKEMPETIFDFNRLDLTYYRDYYVDFRHSVEISNGVKLQTGISSHYRKAVNRPSFMDENRPGGKGIEVDENLFRSSYRSFAPRLIVSWTPGQYYYMNGKRKINLHSRFPTFSVDWERGLKGVFGTVGGYERIEFDMQHTVPLGVLRTIYYRAGGGFFSNQDHTYFVDFANFSRNNLPEGWNDEIGGTFHLLDRRWYNASRKYLRANVTYESPLFLIPSVLKHTHFVINERLYMGMVTMPRLNPYIEVGYGIGTHIFDLGVFASFLEFKYEKIGFKITFELFNR